MTRFGIAVALVSALSAAVPGMAETVRVQAGEHPGFSRIVLNFRSRVDWTQQREGVLLEIDTGRQDFDIDFDVIDRRIHRGRLRAIRYEPDRGVIALEIPCLCEASLFVVAGNALAIDIKGDPDIFASLRPRPRPQQGSETQTPQLALVTDMPGKPEATADGGGEDGSPAAGPDEADQMSLPDVAGMPVPKSATPDMPSAPAAPAVELPTLLTTRSAIRQQEDPALPAIQPANPAIGALEQQLLQELARAASDDVLTVNLGEAAQQLRVPPDAETEAAAQIAARQAVIETIFERSLASDSDPQRNHDDDCHPASMFDFALGRDVVDPGRQIAKARSNLYDDLGQVSEPAIFRLAETYLGLGFGVEATALLKTFDVEGAQAEFVADIALMLDGRPTAFGALDGQLDCDGPAAMWAVLATDGRNMLRGVNLGQVTQSFSAMSPNLRRFLGPKLVQQLRFAGHADAAETVRNAIDRLPGDAEARMEQLRADEMATLGEVDQAQGILTDLVRDNSEISAEAFAELMQTRLDAGQRIDDDMIVLAEAHMFEDGTSELADRFRLLIPRGLAERGDLIEAYDYVTQNPALVPDSEHALLQDTLARVLTDTTADGLFVETVFRNDLSGNTAMIRAETALGFSQRLLALGFPKQAARAIAPHADSNDPAMRLLRAELALANGDVNLALALSAGQNDANFDDVRTRAAEMLESRSAPAAGAEVSQNAAAGPVAGSVLPDAVDVTPLAPATDNAALSRAQSPALPEPSLKRSAETLETSRGSRSRIQQLLDSDLAAEL